MGDFIANVYADGNDPVNREKPDDRAKGKTAEVKCLRRQRKVVPTVTGGKAK